MTALSLAERARLVALWREVSPRDLDVTRPDLRPDLKARTQFLLRRRPLAILFDVYGTLVVSAAGGEPSRPPLGGAPGPAKRLLDQALLGAGWRTGASAFARAVSQGIIGESERLRATMDHPEVDREAVVGRVLEGRTFSEIRRLAILHEAWVNPCAVMPGALETLRDLANAGFRLGLVSNAQFFTPLLLEALWGQSMERLGFESELCVFSHRLGVAKPDSLLFRMAHEALGEGVPPEDLVFIGNSSENDVAPARALGWQTALFAGDTRSFRPSAPGSGGATPDLVLTSWTDLPLRIPGGLGTSSDIPESSP